MKKHILLMLSVVIAAVLGSCSKDDPFGYENSTGETGGLLTQALKVSLSSEDGPRSLKGRGVKAKAPSADLFKVAIFMEDSDQPYVEYDYAEMPDIVTLPVGVYYVKAYYGENEAAAWDAPYYEGISDKFEIVKNKITDTLAPIECSIANVRVSILLTDNLKKAITGDYKVTVKVNDVGSLIFTSDRIEGGESGYFRYVKDSNTLVAVFEGEVDGAKAIETKTDINVLPGRHYIITFKLYDAGEEDPGSITGGEDGLIVVDSTVKEEGIIDGNIYFDEENIKDDMRPNEGNKPGTEDPEQPGIDDPIQGEKPSIVGEAPVDLDKVNVLPDDDTPFPVAIQVHSSSDKGITSFTVSVNMAGVSDDELYGLGLAPEMDLVNPDPSYEEKLINLGFPVRIGGDKDVRFEITNLMGLLKILEGTHEFKLTVGDEFGVTTKSLKIQCN